MSENNSSSQGQASNSSTSLTAFRSWSHKIHANGTPRFTVLINLALVRIKWFEDIKQKLEWISVLPSDEGSRPRKFTFADPQTSV